MTSRLSSSKHALRRIGTMVQGCRIERLIGTGGMSVVYAATRQDGQHVAIKFMLERFHDDPKMVQLFSREANVANQVGHPGAVPVLDCSVDEDGCAFLLMPLLEGETVRMRWERANLRLPLVEAGVILSDVLDVLASAHDHGIVHRDIKPENLFIMSTGDVRVLDFGIARRADRDGSITVTGNLIGTPAFMSPEQALADRHSVGPTSDCWAVGATLFSLLSGQFVHDAASGPGQFAAAATRHARSLEEVAPNLPLSIVRFVDKALSFDPKDRWPSARAMRDALHATLEGVTNDSMAAMTIRARARFASDLSLVTEPTRVKPSSREASPSRRPAPVRPWMRFVHADIEVRAPLPKLFGPMTETANRVLADHGLGQYTEGGWFVPDTRLWWPMEAHVAAIHALIEAVGSIKGMDIGKRAEKFVTLPPDPMMHNIHATLGALDVAYHLNHRKTNGELMFDVESGQMVDTIGHYHCRGQGDDARSIVMECENPYPCEMDHGIILGFARRFEPYAVVEHAPGGCRKDGAESCIYHVTWW